METALPFPFLGSPVIARCGLDAWGSLLFHNGQSYGAQGKSLTLLPIDGRNQYEAHFFVDENTSYSFDVVPQSQQVHIQVQNVLTGLNTDAQAGPVAYVPSSTGRVIIRLTNTGTSQVSIEKITTK